MWRGKPTRTTQHNVRDPFVYLFVNEGNKTGNLIFGLCFPMASLDVERAHLEMEESGGDGGQAWYLEGAGLRASWAPARYSWVGKLGAPPRNICYALRFQ